MQQLARLMVSTDSGATPLSMDDVPEGTAKEALAGGRVIALFHVQGQFYALDGVCPHAGGPLGCGALAGTTITCPWHGWQFDVTTGRHGFNPRYQHPAFRVIVDGNALFVDLGESSGALPPT